MRKTGAFTSTFTDVIYRKGGSRLNAEWWKDRDNNWRLLRWSLVLLAVLLVVGLVAYFLVIDLQSTAPILTNSVDETTLNPIVAGKKKIPEGQWTSPAADDVVSLDGDVILDLGEVTDELQVTPGKSENDHPSEYGATKNDSSKPDFIEIVPAPDLGTSTTSDDDKEPQSISDAHTTAASTDVDTEFLLATSQLLNKLKATQTANKAMNISKVMYSADRILDEIRKHAAATAKAYNYQSTLRSPVFPTLPTSTTAQPKSEEDVTANYGEEGLCFSPRLEMCRGVLPYDLATLPSVPGINSIAELDSALPYFEMILQSGCSERSRQFFCSLLEPACQPMGDSVLLPCRKACKAVAEECGDFVLATLDLSKVFQCDMYPDSDDASQCVNFARGDACLRDEFHCPDGSCIPSRWLCDNVEDCPLAADESNCTHCAKDQFRCTADGKCLSNSWRCDGYKDCDDGSDEVGCSSAKAQPREQLSGTPHTSPCPVGELRCVDGRCITVQQLCDGHADCSDGSDEASCV